MPDLLILTVGTGTAGRQSNIAEGLRHTIRLIAPRAYWLVPSTSEESLLVADLVREGLPGFSFLHPGTPYETVSIPDDLESCRQTLRRLIRSIRPQLRSGERLLLNPTSGTKQMTAAATLAALDEGLGEITFTVGDRADGVVITGTERLTTFDPAVVFQERDLAQAREATALGAFAAAERMLAPHRHTLPRAHATAECLRHWQRQDYAAAAGSASRFDDTLRRHLRALADDVAQKQPSSAIIADLLEWAAHHHRLGEADTAINLAYKTLELAAQHRIKAITGGLPPYSFKDTDEWAISADLKRSLRDKGRNGAVFCGLVQAMQVLKQLGDPLGITYQQDPRYYAASQIRNELNHHIAPASPTEAHRLLDLTRNLVHAHIELPNPFSRPSL